MLTGHHIDGKIKQIHIKIHIKIKLIYIFHISKIIICYKPSYKIVIIFKLSLKYVRSG